MTLVHFLPLYKTEAKISQIWALPFCTGDVFWSQSTHSGDQRFWGSTHIVSRLSCEQNSAVNHDMKPHFYIIKSETTFRKNLFYVYFDVLVWSMSYSLTSPSSAISKDLWPVLQPATRGQRRCFGFTFRELWCFPFLYIQYMHPTHTTKEKTHRQSTVRNAFQSGETSE